MNRGWLLFGLLLLTACAKQAESTAAAAPETALRSPEGAFLAYEHSVEIALPAKEIPERLSAAQKACTGGAFGECSVLNVDQRGGDYPSGSLTVRIVPRGIEPLIAQASQGADIGSRSTRAEDLAQVVRDNTSLQARLQKEQARLQEFQQRRDLSVADMIALSQQLAQVDAQLEAAQRDGAQHRRRVDTQLLTLEFRPPGGQAGRGEIGQALRDFGQILAVGTAWTIRAFAFLIPLIVVAGAGMFFWRRMRRRKPA